MLKYSLFANTFTCSFKQIALEILKNIILSEIFFYIKIKLQEILYFFQFECNRQIRRRVESGSAFVRKHE